MTSGSSFDELDRLTTDELRDRAFARAEERKDLAFFWDLAKHLPAAASLESDDGSAGGVTGGVAESIALVREMFGQDLGEFEPLIRARFIAYLSEAG